MYPKASYQHGGVVEASSPTPALLHPKEMVLPKYISEPLMRMVRGEKTGTTSQGVMININNLEVKANNAEEFIKSLLTKMRIWAEATPY